MNGWSQQLRLCGHCAPLCLLTSRLIHKSSSASEAALDRPSGEVADAACQKPTWGGGVELPGKVVWKTLGSGEMAKRKCQVGARKKNCQNKWASEEKGLPSHGNWKRSVSPPHPCPSSLHPNLHCYIFNAALSSVSFSTHSPGNWVARHLAPWLLPPIYSPPSPLTEVPLILTVSELYPKERVKSGKCTDKVIQLLNVITWAGEHN